MDKTSWTCSIKYIKCKITSPPQQWIFIWLKFQSKDLNRMQGRVPRPRGAGSCRGPRKAGRAVRLYRLLAGRRLYTCVHPSSALWQIVFFIYILHFYPHYQETCAVIMFTRWMLLYGQGFLDTQYTTETKLWWIIDSVFGSIRVNTVWIRLCNSLHLSCYLY